MTLLDGDALLDTLAYEIARVAGLRLRMGRAADNWTTGRSGRPDRVLITPP